MLRATPRHLAGESGIALIAAMIVLTIVGLLAAAAITVSFDTASSTTRDEHSKAALEAAEAGLRVAAYRMDMLEPQTGRCIDETKVVEPNEVNGYCSAATEEALGNGASYRYWTTPELRAGMKCVGQYVSESEQMREELIEREEAIVQRCVTAEGIVNGVHARAQARVAAFVAAPLFPVAGIVGLKLVEIGGKTILNTAVNSNYKIISNGNSAEQYASGYCELAYKGTFEGSKESGRPCYKLVERTEAEGEYVVTPVPAGSSAEESPSGTECEVKLELKKNCDVRITNGIADAKGAKLEPHDEISEKKGSVTFTPSSSTTEPRFMSLKGGGSWTIGAGKYIYNFCNFTAEGGSITVAAKGEAEIFIEAPESEEPGSGCPAGSGKLEFSGGTVINNLNNENPTALQFYVYGKGPVIYKGKANALVKLAMTLDAPEAFVELDGIGTFTGGIIGNQVKTEGEFAFEWRKEEEELKMAEEPATASYHRTAWTQCTPEAEAPTEGC